MPLKPPDQTDSPPVLRLGPPAELGLSVSAGGSERLLRPPRGDLYPRAGHELPGAARQDQDLRLPEPLHSRRWSEGAPQVVPQQIHSGVWQSRVYLRASYFLRGMFNI